MNISLKTHTMNMQKRRQPYNRFGVVNEASPQGLSSSLLDRSGMHMQDSLKTCWTLQPPYALLS